MKGWLAVGLGPEGWFGGASLRIGGTYEDGL